MKPTAQAAPLPLRKEICTEHTSAPLLLLLLRRAARLVSFSFSFFFFFFFFLFTTIFILAITLRLMWTFLTRTLSTQIQCIHVACDRPLLSFSLFFCKKLFSPLFGGRSRRKYLITKMKVKLKPFRKKREERREKKEEKKREEERERKKFVSWKPVHFCLVAWRTSKTKGRKPQ